MAENYALLIVVGDDNPMQPSKSGLTADLSRQPHAGAGRDFTLCTVSRFSWQSRGISIVMQSYILDRSEVESEEPMSRVLYNDGRCPHGEFPFLCFECQSAESERQRRKEEELMDEARRLAAEELRQKRAESVAAGVCPECGGKLEYVRKGGYGTFANVWIYHECKACGGKY